MGGATNANILLNADKTIGQGFELDFEAYLTDNLLVTLAQQLQRHRDQATPTCAVAACAQRCTVTDPPIDASGTRR